MLEGIQNHYTLIKENNHVLHHTTTAECHQWGRSISLRGLPPTGLLSSIFSVFTYVWDSHCSLQSRYSASNLSSFDLRSILKTTYWIMLLLWKLIWASHCPTVMVTEHFKSSSKQPLQRHYPSLTHPYVPGTLNHLLFPEHAIFLFYNASTFLLVLFAVSSPSIFTNWMFIILHYLAQTPLSL